MGKNWQLRTYEPFRHSADNLHDSRCDLFATVSANYFYRTSFCNFPRRNFTCPVGMFNMVVVPIGSLDQQTKFPHGFRLRQQRVSPLMLHQEATFCQNRFLCQGTRPQSAAYCCQNYRIPDDPDTNIESHSLVNKERLDSYLMTCHWANVAKLQSISSRLLYL